MQNCKIRKNDENQNKMNKLNNTLIFFEKTNLKVNKSISFTLISIIKFIYVFTIDH